MTQQTTDFETRTRELLDESAGRLDGRTLSRLIQARHAALDRANSPGLRWRSWLPVGAATAAGVLAVMIWMGPGGEGGTQTMAGLAAGGNAFEDIDLLVDAPEFVSDADDLDFYEWAVSEVES
jgi:hypothetical protein